MGLGVVSSNPPPLVDTLPDSPESGIFFVPVSRAVNRRDSGNAGQPPNSQTSTPTTPRQSAQASRNFTGVGIYMLYMNE